MYSFLSNLENVLSLLLKIFLHSSPSCSTPTVYSSVFLFQLLSRVWLSAIPRTAAGFPVLNCLPEFAQTCVHWASDAIHPFHPLLPPSPPALSLFQHQGIFQWVGITCMLSYFSLYFSEVYYFSFFSLSFWIAFIALPLHSLIYSLAGFNQMLTRFMDFFLFHMLYFSDLSSCILWFFFKNPFLFSLYQYLYFPLHPEK